MSDHKHYVCRVEDLPPGSHQIVDVAGVSIGVFNVDGNFHALLNRCPHKAAPLCRGRVTGLVTGDRSGDFQFERDGEIIRCPWHGWEFDITTGCSVFNPHRIRTRSFPVSIEVGAPPATEDEAVPVFPTSVSKGWVAVSLRRRTARSETEAPKRAEERGPSRIDEVDG